MYPFVLSSHPRLMESLDQLNAKMLSSYESLGNHLTELKLDHREGKLPSDRLNQLLGNIRSYIGNKKTHNFNPMEVQCHVVACGQYKEMTFMEFQFMLLWIQTQPHWGMCVGVCPGQFSGLGALFLRHGWRWALWWCRRLDTWTTQIQQRGLNCFLNSTKYKMMCTNGCMHASSYHRLYTVISFTSIGQAVPPLPTKSSHQAQGQFLYMQHAWWKQGFMW